MGYESLCLLRSGASIDRHYDLLRLIYYLDLRSNLELGFSRSSYDETSTIVPIALLQHYKIYK